MADYQFDFTLVADPNTFQRAANAAVTVYDVADASNSAPLALKDLNGLPLPNPLTSTADAFIPAFVTTSAQVKLVGGGLTVYVGSYNALLTEVTTAQAAASTSATAATSAQSAAQTAADQATAAATSAAGVSAALAIVFGG